MILTLSMLLAIWLIAGTWLLGRRSSDYHPALQTISELGASGASHEYQARLILFLPTGLMAALIATLLLNHDRPSAAALGLSIAIGYLSAAAFPVDRGVPLRGTRANQWHNIGGLIMYLGGALSLFAAWPRGYGFAVAGVVALIGLVGLTPLVRLHARGRLQRLMETAFLAALIAHSIL